MKNQTFVSLNSLLLQDNEQVKKLKSIYKKEEEYANVLGPIEHAIATFYLENRKLKDKDVEKAVKNIRLNFDKEIGYFKEPIEREIILAISAALQKRKITRHELWLVLSYIPWSIDNRKWLNTSRAYLDWLLQFFGITERDMLYYETENSEVSKEQEIWSRKDSEKFAQK